MTGLDQDAPERRRGDRAFRGWRGPLLAALVALLCGLPGVFGHLIARVLRALPVTAG